MRKTIGLIIAILLISCKNSEPKKVESSADIDTNASHSDFRKVETNNSLELEFQILDENNERVEFARLEKLAEFPGGFDSLAVFIQRNFVFPESVDSLHIEGRVESLFSVDTTGKVVDVELKEGLIPEIDHASLSVISKLPDWKPAELRDGQKVKMRFLLPFKFVPEE